MSPHWSRVVWCHHGLQGVSWLGGCWGCARAGHSPVLVSQPVPKSAGINPCVPALLGCWMGQQRPDSLALHVASGCPFVEHQQPSSAKKGVGDFFSSSFF